MLFSETDQVLDLDLLAFITDNHPVISPKHLVYLTGNDAQVGFCQAVFERGEYQIEATLRIGELPWMHIITGVVMLFYLFKFVDVVVQNDGILTGFGKVAETTTQVQTDGSPIR